MSEVKLLLLNPHLITLTIKLNLSADGGRLFESSSFQACSDKARLHDELPQSWFEFPKWNESFYNSSKWKPLFLEIEFARLPGWASTWKWLLHRHTH
jgi:hypothetical protein